MTRKEKDFLLSKVEMLEEEKIFMHDSTGNLFQYRGEQGIYIRLTDIFARKVIRERLQDNGEAKIDYQGIEFIRRELSESLELNGKFDGQKTSEFIVVQNGRVDLRTGELLGHDKNAYDTVALDFKFLKDAKIEENSVTGKFLKEALGIKELDPQKSPKLKLFYQAISYSLSNLPNAKKLPILLGTPNTGKSVILKLCTRIIGQENVQALSLIDLTDKYRGGLLSKAKLITCHEIRLGNLKRLDIVKSIISGDPVTLEEKFVKAFTYVPNVKILMAANALPELGEIDAGGAFAERLLPIPFAKREGDNDVTLLDKLYEERDVLFSVIFREMQNFIADGFKFAETQESQKLIDDYKESGNSLNAFLAEHYESERGTSNNKVGTVKLYEDYKAYCDANLLYGCSRNAFRQQLIQLGHKIAKKRLGSNPVSCVLGLKKKPDCENGEDENENINSPAGRRTDGQS